MMPPFRPPGWRCASRGTADSRTPAASHAARPTTALGGLPVRGLSGSSFRIVRARGPGIRHRWQDRWAVLAGPHDPQVSHEEGESKAEDILRMISAALTRMTRDCDVIARLGEGGFAVLLPETGCRGGQVMADRLSKYFIKELPAAAEAESSPELNWGLASFPEEVRLPEKLYACAVEAMRSSQELAPEKVGVYRSSERPEVD